MSKIELPTVTGNNNVSRINDNFKKIEDALNQEVLYRKGYVGEPNEMETNLDMNGKEILNVATGTSDGSLVTKSYVDQGLSLKFDKSGGTLSGPVDMQNNQINNLPNATQPSQPATYAQLLQVESAEDSLLRSELAAAGGVGLVGGAWIVPEMFYSGSGSHSSAVQEAFDRSDATGEQVYLGGQYFFDVPVSVKNGVNVISGQRASVSPYSGSGNGTAFDFVAGNANRRFELPAISGFRQVGVPSVAVRCDLAQIYVRQFVGCHTCYKTITDASNNSILDVILEFNTMSGCEVAWEMYCGAAGNVVQGCVLKGSFITDTTRVFKRTGVAAYDDGNVVDVYAVDFTNRCAGGAFLDNQVAGYQVPRFTAKVQSWFGGDGFTLTGANAVRVVVGQFVAGEMYLALVTAIKQESLLANQWRSGVLQTMSTVATLGTVRDMPNTPTLASFNGGVALSQTEMILRLTLTADLAPGAQAVGYFYNVFADGSYPRWQATPIEGNTRLMLASIKDQSGTEASRVELAVRNIDSSPVVAGQSVIFRVSRR